MVSRNGLGLRIRPVPLSIQMIALPGERVFIQIIKEDKLLLVWSLSTVEHFKNYSCICSTSFGEKLKLKLYKLGTGMFQCLMIWYFLSQWYLTPQRMSVWSQKAQGR